MSDSVHLRGMAWDHSRGYDPMAATSEAYARKHPGVRIEWEKRSLQAFADRPIGEMAERYDLMVIDHPHVGEAARSGLLLPLDGLGRDGELEALAARSVGASHASYEFHGRQWALAIDAAAPVACRRPDRLGEAPRRWEEVLELAGDGAVGFALVPINALMTWFGLARNKGYAVAQGELVMEPGQSAEIIEAMREILALMDPRCLDLDPIGVYEWMGRNEEAPSYSPFGYGYANYSRAGYCRFPLAFCDAPGFGSNGPRGAVIGGTGIAASARSGRKEVAVDYAFWIASAECQKGLFFESGGQPANAAAWEDEACNAASLDFFRNTRETLETAWLRPRHDGYMGFQGEAGRLIHSCLRGERGVGAAVEGLQAAWEGSLP